MTFTLPEKDDLFTPKAASLDSLLPDIHRHKIALPEFQRPWVWEPEMVRDLIISVAYRYPAGSLLSIPAASEDGFALRPFSGSGEKLSDTPSLVILDGQQRLTSLYQAVYRQDGVHYKSNVYYFYLDVAKLMEDPDGILTGDPYFEASLFFVRKDRKNMRVRYEGLQPLYDISTFENEVKAAALPLGCIFDADGYLAKWKQKYLVGRSGKDMDAYLQLDGQWDRLVQPWIQRIRTYRFPMVELDHGMPLGAICHVFEKVNSTGVPLDVFDLCNAILWAQGFQLNAAWKKTKESLISLERIQPLSGTYFLQGLSLVSSMARKRSEPDRDISVSCRKQDLLGMRRDTMETWWKVLISGYKEAEMFMTEQGILAQRILPYTTLITPLSAILADLKHRKTEAAVRSAWPKIAQWYWCSVFGQRYSSQVETNAAKDYEQVVNWIDGGDQPDVVRTFSFRSDVLQEITSIRNAVYKGVLCLLARQGARDFSGGGKLSTNLFFDTAQDHHHIFPSKALNDLGVKDLRTNTIVNKTLIGHSVNRNIGGKLPSQYIKEWRNKLEKDKVGTWLFDQILDSHLVDPEIMVKDNWPAFLADRREKLRQMVVKACGGNVQSFTDELEEFESDQDDESF